MLPFQPETVAEALLNALDAAVAARGQATLAIPGGRSPAPVLQALARMCTPFVRAHLHVLWVDERALPLGDPERNDGPTLAAWSSGGPLPAAIHPMPAEWPDLEAAANAYAATIHSVTAGAGFDAVLLGIGEDGHVASLFPDHRGLDELDPVFAVYDSPKPPARRLTVSLPLLMRSRFIAVLALGAGKRTVVAHVRSGDRTRNIPASLLPSGPTVWFVDAAAAG